ncbi:DUF3137 domain-containing protein [Oceanithermus sp.]
MEVDGGFTLPPLDEFITRMENLEEVRKKASAAAGRAWLTALLLWALAFAAGVYLIGGVAGWVVFGLAAVGIFVWALARNHGALAPYRQAYKEQVLAPLVEAILPGFEHRPEDGISEETYLASRLFPARPDRYHSEDLFSGEVAGVPLTFSEVHAEEEHEDCDDDGCETSYSTIFKGLFAVAEFPKAFEGTVLVYPDRSEKYLGLLSRSLQKLGGRFRGLQLVKLEDPEFERRFVVYGDDPVTTRYVLSTSMMAALTRFRDRYGQIFASFINGNLYLAIPVREDLFEPPPVWRKAVDPERLRRYAEALAMMRGVVGELGLNIRIWGERALE